MNTPTAGEVSWQQRMLPLLNVAPFLVALAIGQIAHYYWTSHMESEHSGTVYTSAPDSPVLLIVLLAVLLLPIAVPPRRLFAIACAVIGSVFAAACIALLLTIPFAPVGLALLLAGFARRNNAVVVTAYYFMFALNVLVAGYLLHGQLS